MLYNQLMIEYSYVHIPFCKKKCKYCAFTSFINLNFIEKYVEALLFEIENIYEGTPQKTLYLGGGTPSLLKIEQLEKIVGKFNFQKNPEITIELNPESVDKNYLKGLKDIGFNRLSFGVQTFDDEILKEIGREHNKKSAIEKIEMSKALGFKNISIDLIYGLPNQDIDNWIEALKTAKSLDIEHISTYGLKIEDGTYYKKFPPKNLPDDDIQRKMYEALIKELDNFEHYEFSNFAKKGYRSKHNLNYWNLTPYNGFGVSASGFDGKRRYKNTDNLKEYLKNPLMSKEIIELKESELLEEAVFLGFRKQEGINIAKIEERFRIDFNAKYKTVLEKYLKTGHIVKTKNGYRLSLDGILVSNYILCDFLC